MKYVSKLPTPWATFTVNKTYESVRLAHELWGVLQFVLHVLLAHSFIHSFVRSRYSLTFYFTSIFIHAAVIWTDLSQWDSLPLASVCTILFLFGKRICLVNWFASYVQILVKKITQRYDNNRVLVRITSEWRSKRDDDSHSFVFVWLTIKSKCKCRHSCLYLSFVLSLNFYCRYYCPHPLVFFGTFKSQYNRWWFSHWFVSCVLIVGQLAYKFCPLFHSSQGRTRMRHKWAI